MSAPPSVRARSFDAWAVDYDRYRPGYPDALFDEISARLSLPDRPAVVDLGAGTGIASAAMARRGWRVTAVEPGGPMLAALQARVERERLEVTPVQATAEQTGLPDASADLATAGQAFHWFDHLAAVHEMARVVRPGGGIALFWNMRDDTRSAFLAEYGRLLVAHEVKEDLRGPGRHPDTRRWIAQAGGFDPSEFFQVAHVQRMTPDEFIGLVFTASYVRTRPEQVQAALRADVAALLERHAPGGGPIDVPYLVDCEIARRTGE